MECLNPKCDLCANINTLQPYKAGDLVTENRTGITKRIKYIYILGDDGPPHRFRYIVEDANGAPDLWYRPWFRAWGSKQETQ
jgi:hypothetical protein